MKGIATVITILSFLNRLTASSSNVGECSAVESSSSAVDLSLSSKCNSTGDWVTTFLLGKKESNVTSNVTLDLSQIVTECRGKKTVQLRGVLRGISPSKYGERMEQTSDKLLFHTRCGKNVAVLDDGRTARKINIEQYDHAVVFTHRPLKMNELLEVKLGKKHNKYSYSLGIGVTTLSPMDAPELQHISSIKNKSWVMYHGNIYYNGDESLKNYGKNLGNLEVGNRAGVMRSNTGSLHFFVNGEDQGPAASNIPETVYGMVELWGNAAMVTIVDS